MAKTARSPGMPGLAPATRRFRFAVDPRFGGEQRDPPLPSGSVVDGRYRIVRLIGEGGMGRVYEAEHMVLARRVALKLVREDTGAKPEQGVRFEQEARAASRTGHANIVEVIDCVRRPNEQLYMVMELLSGQSLESWLSLPGVLADGLECLAGICDGLQAAHEAGVIHRDIKPANIFLADDGRGQITPKLLDFGIAKMLHTRGPQFQTEAGTVLGTPFYLAPERASLGDVGAPADVYSVAVILYEMLVGDVPFDGENHMEVIAHQLHTDPLDPRQAAPDRSIPDALAVLTMRGLNKDPNLRPNAATLAASLRELLTDARAELQAVATGPRYAAAQPDEQTRAVGVGGDATSHAATTLVPEGRRLEPSRAESSSTTELAAKNNTRSMWFVALAVAALGLGAGVWAGASGPSPIEAGSVPTADPSQPTGEADGAPKTRTGPDAAAGAEPSTPAVVPAGLEGPDPNTRVGSGRTDRTGAKSKRKRHRPPRTKPSANPSKAASEQPNTGPTIKSDVYDD